MQSQPISGQRLMRVPCWAATHPLDKFTLQTLLLPVEVAVIVQISATQQQAIMGLKKLLRLGRRRGKDDNASSSARTSSDGTATSSIPIPKPLDKSAAPHPTLEEPTEPAATLPRAENSISLRLWNQAYETIRERNRELVEAYEGVLNEQAVFQGLSGATIALGGLTGTAKEQARFGRLLSSAQQSIAKSTKHEDAKAAAIDAVTFLKAIDGLVGPVAATFPPAAMAWAGICAVLPVLVQPLIADKEMVEGLNYIISRMEWYMKLSEVILEDTWDSNAAIVQLRDTLQGSIIEMYGALLEYEMMSVAYCFKDGPFIRPINTILGFHNWEERTEAIKQLEGEFYRSNLQYDNREIVQQLREQRRDQLQREKAERRRVQSKITGRFKTTSYEERMKLNPKRIAGTCEWFQGHEKFQQWLKEPRGLLLVSADPGCGKSVLSRHLVENVLPIQHPEATVCYYFFKDTPEQRGLESAFCALLHRLFYDHGDVANACQHGIESEGLNLFENPVSLASILLEALNQPRVGQVICVLDALDECNPNQCQILVQFLQELFLGDKDTQSRVKFLVTTRGYPKILELFSEFELACVHLSGDSKQEKDRIQKEIGLVIDNRLAALAKKRNLPDTRQQGIRAALQGVDAEQRTYLWVSLVFQVLEKNYDDRTEAWNNLIHDTPSTVFQAYEKLLQHIHPRDSERVVTLFHIIFAAYRPLTLRELNIAIYIRDRGNDVRSESELQLASDTAFRKWLIDTCGFFVTEYDQRVFFIHQTAKEFLVAAPQRDPVTTMTDTAQRRWQGSVITSQAHQAMAESCVAYLSMDDVMNDKHGSITKSSGDGISHGHLQLPFLAYALKEWVYHVFEAERGGQQLAHPNFRKHYCRLFSHSPPLRCPALAKTVCSMGVENERFRYQLHAKGALFGSEGWAAITPASVSIFLGHTSYLQYFLEQDGPTSQSEDEAKSAIATPCYGLHAREFEEFLKDIPPRPGPAQALLFAAAKVDIAALRIVLSVHPSLLQSARDLTGRTVLHIVAEEAAKAACLRNVYRHYGSLRDIAKIGFDVHATSCLGWTVFDHYLNMLSQSLVDVNHRPLHPLGALNDLESLIELGATCNARGRLTVMDVVAMLEPEPNLLDFPDLHHHTDIAEIIASRAFKKAFGESSIKYTLDHYKEELMIDWALHLAAAHGRTWSVLFLLVAGADPNVDIDRQSPLQLAINHEFTTWGEASADTMIRALLYFGGNVNTRVGPEHDDRSPADFPLLHHLIRTLRYAPGSESWHVRFEETFDLLLANGADVNATDSDGNGALHIACQVHVPERRWPILGRTRFDGADPEIGSMREQLIRKLVDHGATIDARNHKGETPLLVACKNHHCWESVTPLLLERGADVHARDDEGQTSVDVIQNMRGCGCHHGITEDQTSNLCSRGQSVTEDDSGSEDGPASGWNVRVEWEDENGPEKLDSMIKEREDAIETSRMATLGILQQYLDLVGGIDP